MLVMVFPPTPEIIIKLRYPKAVPNAVRNLSHRISQIG
jgi:hypothetical protein